MKLDEVVGWYQKKIGTYDKQQWEKTVEQKILDGLSSVQLKTAKLKTDLIDVDLVRGSTFPKAKPKQSLFTVIRLAILRYFLLPLYSQWWVKQTSPNAFAMLLILYILQMVNWAVYTINVDRLETNNNNIQISNSMRVENVRVNVNLTETNQADGEDNVVSLSELLIPMSLSLLLSLIHSQIVATNTASGSIKSKHHRRYSNTGLGGVGAAGTLGNKRMRRRKKLTRLRSNDSTDTSVHQQQQQQHQGDQVKKRSSSPGTITATATEKNKMSDVESYPKTSVSVVKKLKLEQFDIEHNNAAEAINDNENSVEMASQNNECNNNYNNSNNNEDDGDNSSKKRNVNWHSPIHKYANNEIIDKQLQQQTSQNSMSSSCCSSSTTSSMSSSSSSSTAGNIMANTTTSTANNTTNNSEANSPQHLETQSQPASELISESGQQKANRNDDVGVVLVRTRHMGDDDGFESLNGKSSSGEENATKVYQLPAGTLMSNTLLRQRLNAVVAKNNISNNNNNNNNNKNSHNSNYNDKESQEASITSAIIYRNSDDNKVKLPLTAGARKSIKSSSSDIDEEGDDETELICSPASLNNSVSNYNECTTSATEWLGITTNSEECSYCSDMEQSDSLRGLQISDGDANDADFTPALLLNSHGVTDRISCTIWEHREIKKAQLSVLQISSCILERVESMAETNDYIYLGICFAGILSLLPCFCRLCEATLDADNDINILDVPKLLLERSSFSIVNLLRYAFGHAPWQRTILIIGCLQRLCLALLLFIIFAVAERTFKQRFLYAKLFSHLTSSRRARKSNLPHFRLNKVRNIKTWLSVRAYLKKRGPQRSVDVIVSAAFIVTLFLLAFLSLEWMKDSVQMHTQLNLEALMWATFIGIYLLRFMTLGNKIHEKYRSVSVLITEQINLYLQIEQKPKKKEELMVANSVLKLAADLLKELESPFKISGLCANPYLFTTVKVVILSALSGVLSEMLGFKLKLHKIKIK